MKSAEFFRVIAVASWCNRFKLRRLRFELCFGEVHFGEEDDFIGNESFMFGSPGEIASFHDGVQVGIDVIPFGFEFGVRRITHAEVGDSSDYDHIDVEELGKIADIVDAFELVQVVFPHGIFDDLVGDDAETGDSLEFEGEVFGEFSTVDVLISGFIIEWYDGDASHFHEGIVQRRFVARNRYDFAARESESEQCQEQCESFCRFHTIFPLP